MKRVALILFLVAFSPAFVSAKTLTAGTGVVMRNTGTQAIVLGYDNGSLEIRSWSGALIASRSGLGRITALENYRSRGSVQPKIFVGSAENGGTLRLIDPVALSTDVTKRVGLGTITSLWAWQRWIYVGAKSTSGVGTIYRLDNLNFGTLASRTGLGEIKAINDADTGTTKDIVIASLDGSGTVRQLLFDSLAIRSYRNGQGAIYGLDTGDMNNDGKDEIAIASTAGGGCVKMLYNTTLATAGQITGIGAPSCMAMGHVGIAQSDDAGNGKFSIAVGTSGGVMRNYAVTTATGAFSLIGQRTALGVVNQAGIWGAYGTDVDQVVFMNSVGGKIEFHIASETLVDMTKFSVTPLP